MSKTSNASSARATGIAQLDAIAAGRHLCRMIYKIFRADEWAALQQDGETAGAPVDLEDGYIHFSAARQVVETAAKHFAGEADLILVSVDERVLGRALKWETSRNSQLFPHLYRKLTLADVVGAQRITHDGTRHIFPDDIT